MEKGRNELILESIIHQTVYTDPPESRIEDLLLQLKDVIEAGGGGSGDASPLTPEQMNMLLDLLH